MEDIELKQSTWQVRTCSKGHKLGACWVTVEVPNGIKKQSKLLCGQCFLEWMEEAFGIEKEKEKEKAPASEESASRVGIGTVSVRDQHYYTEGYTRGYAEGVRAGGALRAWPLEEA